MSTGNLKKELETALLITNWHPTESELLEIARRINGLSNATSKTDIEKIVLDVVDSYDCVSMEGVDNADLKTLILMATKTTKK